jgi:hypothetical protein
MHCLYYLQVAMHYVAGWILSTTLPKYKKLASGFDVIG